MIRRVVAAAARIAFLVMGLGVLFGLARRRSRSPDPIAAADRHPAVSPRTWRWGITAVTILTIIGFLGAAVIVSGIVPIKASDGHWAVTAWLLQFAKRRSVSTHTIATRVPAMDDDRLVLKGAAHYQLACRPCHGGPDLAQPRIARGMTPRPPILQSTVSAYDSEDLFYIVKHGIKFTGMPAWPAQRRDDEVWAVVAFLLKLPQLDAETYRQLSTGRNSGPTSAAPLEDLLGPQTVPRAVVESCSRCHGIDGLGRGKGAFPSLAGQHLAYLNGSLQAYATGERHSGIMEPVVAGLDSRELIGIAKYYSTLDGRTTGAADPGSMPDIARGKEIATRGLPDQLVPPCAKCHGPKRERHNPNYPMLAGQYADYIALQLSLFKVGSRGGTAFQGIMRRVAGQLTEEQMRAVALYYGSLPAEATHAPIQ